MKNNKGFIMTEALVISAIVLTALILIYAQFSRIERAYSNDYVYNNVNGIYKLNQIASFINEDGLTSLLTTPIIGYSDLTSCSFASNLSYCNLLLDSVNIKHLVIAINSKTILFNKLNESNPYKLGFTNFMKTIDDSDLDYAYQLIAEFKDGTYAAIPYGYGIDSGVCRYTAGKTWEFNYTGALQNFKVPCNGTYKLEVWGAQGGDASTAAGGAGGYATGNKEFTKDTILSIVVGGVGGTINSTDGSVAGGYNGGGLGRSKYSQAIISGSGGGATHIALYNGNYGTLASYGNATTAGNYLYLVAGGGGGAAYNKPANFGEGGYGGGLTGGNGGSQNSRYGTGGTQEAGGYFYNVGVTSSGVGSFGQGGIAAAANGDYFGGAGGGGYYGGGASSSGYTNGGGGGSSYIGGVTNGSTIAGNAAMPKHDGTTGTMTGNAGNGYARITVISVD